MDKQQKTFNLIKERKIYERLDVFPFIIIQSLLLIIYTNSSINSLIRGVIFGCLCLLQGLTFFCKFWSENLMALICYYPVTSIDKATHVKVDITSEKFKMNNRNVICQLFKDSDSIRLELEKIMYVWSKEKGEFFRPKLDILKQKKVGEFLEIEPIQSDQVKKLRSKFGENRMKIPIPSFFSLYKEHIVAPFFVFQLFCILLWVFDDYGLHSMITLFMLCVFEVTVVGQRIFNLATLRNMRVPPHYINVYRNSQWTKIPSSELLPGDIVSVIDGASVVNINEEEDDETKKNFILQMIKRLKEMKKKDEERKKQKSINTIINKYKEKDQSPLTCDLLLLSGSVVVNESMLTGESVPQIKDSVTKLDYLKEIKLDTKLKHKNSILFAGTKVVQAERNEEHEKLPKNVKTPPPDRGAICMVIKTGFSTSQGKLLRTVLYSSERNKGGDTKEAFIFIGILLVIALIASYYVLVDGLEREGGFTYKLLLRCIIIITSVVPAELPIELSLTINNSLFFLQSKRIVCIEPFRIPFAGKIDICCFDKTGTLTKDEFIMGGIVKPKENEPQRAFDSKEETLSVLLGCNSLLNINGKPIGDPIEVAMFKEVRGKLEKNEITCERKTKILPIRKYQFESNLKRMTVLARVYSGIYQKVYYTRVLCKGAPETIKELLKEVPEGYDECYRKWAKDGYRILALAYNDNDKYDYNTKREELEKELTFVGFAIVETPLKAKIPKYIKELITAKYDVCIITGDHVLTTSKVSKDLELGPNKFGLLKIEKELNSNRHIMNWYDLDDKFIKTTLTVQEIKNLMKEYTLGATGDQLKLVDEVKEMENRHEMMQYIKLFCRVSPTQKDDIIKDLIKCGRNPSMCGDGSNDVGALKRATIGVALLNIEETETQKKQPFNFLSFEDETVIKNGDVTAAAPFTSKSGSIKCIKNIFIQGRCTLVTNFQMYKILALNCLLTAYSESVLALKGIKFSDYQSTYMGFAISIFFLMLSKAVPLNKVNSNHPPTTIFTWPAIISIIGQAVVDLGAMVLVLYLTEQIDPLSIGQVKSLDEKFTPTLINTIMFIFQMVNQTITFVVNYQGEPFMENLGQNSAMKKLVFGIIAITAVIIFDLYPQLNETLELVPLPDDTNYRMMLCGIMFFNFVLCYLLEKWKSLFGLYEPFPKQKPKKKK